MSPGGEKFEVVAAGASLGYSRFKIVTLGFKWHSLTPSPGGGPGVTWRDRDGHPLVCLDRKPAREGSTEAPVIGP